MSIEKKEVMNVTMKLVKATSMQQFIGERGRRRMNQPYWVEGDETLVFDFIGIHTKRDILEAQISRGIVWVQEKYGG